MESQSLIFTFQSNPFEWAAQWQQQPIVRGGAILKEEWWQLYEVPPDGAYDFRPDFVGPQSRIPRHA